MNFATIACFNSLIPAGGALAVDRDKFSSMVSSKISNHNLISINREEIKNLNSLKTSDPILIATGPLTSESLADSIISNTGENSLAFFDAIAPIVYFESIDMSKAWFQSRYDKGDGKDYINCPLSKEEYFIFVSELLKSKKIDFKKWEKETPYFEGCMPIEVMAERGIETLRHGPLKPFGLTNEHDPSNKPYAVIQLRQDNTLGTLWNIVGFQTKMTYEEQKRVFKTIPGLENANFARLGGLHRNTFINSPSLLNNELSLKSSPNIFFAGQITGVEGYVESSAIGLLAGLFISLLIKNKEIIFPPNESALGSLLNHVTNNANRDTFQPMNINFGLFPNIISNDGKQKKIDKRLRRNLISQNALDKINEWAILINKIKKI